MGASCSISDYIAPPLRWQCESVHRLSRKPAVQAKDRRRTVDNECLWAATFTRLAPPPRGSSVGALMHWLRKLSEVLAPWWPGAARPVRGGLSEKMDR